MRTSLQWTVGPCTDPQQMPERFVPAQVPGAAQLDWARAEGWAPVEYAGNPSDYFWMEESYWLYRAQLEFAPPKAGEKLSFYCGGVDYQFEVRLNGIKIHQQEGMFTPFSLDLTNRASPGDWLEILVFPAPKTHFNQQDRFQANQSVKPAVSYGWDFHPRLIPLGIWEETYLETSLEFHLLDAELRYELNQDFSSAELSMEVKLNQGGPGSIRWRLLDPQNMIVVDQTSLAEKLQLFQAALAQPELWWPNGQGKPTLYRSIVELFDEHGGKIGEISSRVGFRRVKLVMPPTGWNDPEEASIPRGVDRPPMTMEINGCKIFCKGSNWVTPDIFPGRLTAEDYKNQLTFAKTSNFNILRCWGGANVQKEAFFDLCDEFGLMIWQEFPLSCMRYEGTPAYLKILDQESRSIILRLRRHPSVVMWCGGNELFNHWSRMTNQDLAIRLLDRNCYDLDPYTPFIPTSPQMGMGHGWYCFVIPDGREVLQYFPQARRTAYTEYGVSGVANLDVLQQILPPEEQYPPKPGTAWELRHGFRAWDGSVHSWLELPTLKHYFHINSIEELVTAGQFLQAEGLRFVYEECRRQKPYCAMSLSWCFNEPWPTAANNNLLCWPTSPKPALEKVAQACRPVLASAKAGKISWQPGETFSADLWLLNDLPEALPAGRMNALLRVNNREIPLLTWDFSAAEVNTNLSGPTARCILPEGNFERFELHLRVEGHPEWDSVYPFLRNMISEA